MQRGEDVASANERFRELQGAYECLVDSRERSWYDAHRDDILRGGGSGGEESSDDDDDDDEVRLKKREVNLWPYFSSNAFFGFDESPMSFWAVYGAAFELVENSEKCDEDERTPFGDSSSSWDVVKEFYDRFVDFRSDRSFAAYDKWKISGEEPRNVRRAAEADNKRRRKAAKAQYQDMVSQLALWCRKRDPRVAARIEKIDREKKEREAKQAEEMNARRQENLLARQRWREENVNGEGAAFEAYEVRSGVTLNDLQDEDEGRRSRRSKKKGRRRNDEDFFDGQRNRRQYGSGASENGGGEAQSADNKDGENGSATRVVDEEEGEVEVNAAVVLEDDENVTIGEEDVSQQQLIFACDLCKKTFKSEKQMDNHLQSKAHKKKASR